MESKEASSVERSQGGWNLRAESRQHPLRGLLRPQRHPPGPPCAGMGTMSSSNCPSGALASLSTWQGCALSPAQAVTLPPVPVLTNPPSILQPKA